VPHPVPALLEALHQAQVAAQCRVVAGQPGGHGQKLPDGDLDQPRVGARRQMASEQRTDRLVQALEPVVGEGDTDQGAGKALGHRKSELAGVGVAVPVALIDQLAVADDQQAAQLGMVGGLGVQVGRQPGVHADRGGWCGAPASRGPIVALSRQASRPTARRRPPALLAAAAAPGYQQAGHHDHRYPAPPGSWCPARGADRGVRAAVRHLQL
jgi:hypothetical protein